MIGTTKRQIKQLLGDLPLTAEIYWQVRQSDEPLTRRFSLKRLEKSLPEWNIQAQDARHRSTLSPTQRKRVFLFGVLRQWIQQTTLLGMTIAGLGHDVTLAFLPYSDWKNPLNRFDHRRQNIYVKNVMKSTEPVLKAVSFLDSYETAITDEVKLSNSLLDEIEKISTYDVQYTLQIEDFDTNQKNTEPGKLYQLRLERNTQAAATAYAWLTQHCPDIALVPNGSILEFGAIYQVVRHLGIPVVTYEFGEQHHRIWIAQNAEVMQQDTTAMWNQFKDNNLDEQQLETIKTLYRSRQQASLWENFARRWQGIPSQGGNAVRADLGLDDRPIALLATNVIGDSLTLGRQAFSESMTEWLQDTIRYFAKRQDLQLVVRVHPGERYTKGPSVLEIIQKSVQIFPKNIHLIPANAPINTYDLIEIADLGLVYTTTVGMEIAMAGVPVIVAGNTHYRNKGFSLDPTSYQEYHSMLDKCFLNSHRNNLSKEQVEKAWNYAYRFFFEYPCIFPWHLHFFALNEHNEWPIKRVLSDEGLELFGNTFRYLLGESRDWSRIEALPAT